jgi:purine-nucleoside phosphorylase
VNYLEQIKEAVSVIQERIPEPPEVGIICGTGLGSIADEIENPVVIPYSEIPHFPMGAVEGHKNRILAGKIGNKSVLAFQGRFHYYEGHDMKTVTLPARVLQMLNIKLFIVTNAAGGLNRNFRVGDVMLIEDHINFMFQNPLIGKNFDELGPRFPDMSEPYTKSCITQLEELALKHGTRVQKGTYLAVTGPSYETRAELRFFNKVADAVGMSTVPEVICANHGNIPKIVGLSVVTNMATGEDVHKESHDAVVKAANEATPRVVKLVTTFIKETEL